MMIRELAIAAALCTACTTLPKGEETTDAAGSTNAATVPCVHRTTDGSLRRDTDVLPEGACVVDPDEPVCEQIVRDACPCVNIQIPRYYYACTCVSGIWSCELTAQDMGVCGPGCPGTASTFPCVLEDGGLLEVDAGTPGCFDPDGG